MGRAKESFDMQQELLSAGKDILATGKKAAKIPALASDALSSLVKGRTKVNMELTGYDELFGKAKETVRYVVLAIFASILFIGSCLLCLSDIEPKTSGGLPLIALAGFVFSIALAIYTARKMKK